jgi:hypothetical protein
MGFEAEQVFLKARLIPYFAPLNPKEIEGRIIKHFNQSKAPLEGN